MSDKNSKLVYNYEKPLFVASFIVSVLLWGALTIFTIGIGMVYALLILLSLLIAHGIMMAQVKGYGVRVSADQFPQLHQLVTDSAERMGMSKLPSVYLLQLDGMLNAFATHFLSRDFVILTSEMLEACEDDPKRLSFIITHELTHLQRKHTRWMSFLLPARLVPFLGMAYSRACEYTCDAHAAHFGTQNADDAVKALQVLATGSKRWADKINQAAYQQQLNDERGVLTTAAEISSTHPFTAKRVAHIRRVVGGEELPVTKFTKTGLLFSIVFNQQLLIWVFVAVFAGAIFNGVQNARSNLDSLANIAGTLGEDGDLFDAMALEEDYTYSTKHDDPACDTLYNAYEEAELDSTDEYRAFRAYHQQCEGDSFYSTFYPSYTECENSFQAYFNASVTLETEALTAALDCQENYKIRNEAAWTACEATYNAYSDTASGSLEETEAYDVYNNCREEFLASYDA